jgi:hypothetical protein
LAVFCFAAAARLAGFASSFLVTAASAGFAFRVVLASFLEAMATTFGALFDEAVWCLWYYSA